MKLKVFLIAGARPNFMKIAPLYEQMQAHARMFEPILVHTGQHYDENMSKVFFQDLELPQPDIYLGVGSGSHAQQTAEIMKRFEPYLLEQKPDLVLVVGDVNSTLACALTAVKSRMPSRHLAEVWQRFERYLQACDLPDALKRAAAAGASGAPGGAAIHAGESANWPFRQYSHEAPLIAHVEAGERSFDFSMPEEINRVETDVLSHLLFTTCEDSDRNLLHEGLDPRTIFRVGNIMIDSLRKCLDKAGESNILERINGQWRPKRVPVIKENAFVLATLHRPGNVDDPASLQQILRALQKISVDLPVLFPMHPRTRRVLSTLGDELLQQIERSQLLICEPIGYLDFLHLQNRARLVLTDSGGVQVETSYLGIPCLTLRPRTEWQITLREGSNRLVAPDEHSIVLAAKQALAEVKPEPARIQNWDGHTAERIVELLIEIFDLG